MADLDGAHRAARNLAVTLQIIHDGAQALQGKFDDFFEALATRAANDWDADELMDEWDRYWYELGGLEQHENELRRFAWQLARFHWGWRKAAPLIGIGAALSVLAYARQRARTPLGEVLGFRGASMTVALCRIMYRLCHLLDGVEGFLALQRVVGPKMNDCPSDVINDRTDNFVADADEARALSGIDLPALAQGAYGFLRGLDDDYELEREVEREFLLAGAPEDDESAYRPAKEFLDAKRFNGYKSLHQALRDNPWIRWNKPSKNRLRIHAGDWRRYLAMLDAAGFDALDVERRNRGCVPGRGAPAPRGNPATPSGAVAAATSHLLPDRRRSPLEIPAFSHFFALSYFPSTHPNRRRFRLAA